MSRIMFWKNKAQTLKAQRTQQLQKQCNQNTEPSHCSVLILMILARYKLQTAGGRVMLLGNFAFFIYKNDSCGLILCFA